MESKISRLTHEVVDGVCLHLTAEDAALLRELVYRGHGSWGYAFGLRPPSVKDRALDAFAARFKHDIDEALMENPPACKE